MLVAIAAETRVYEVAMYLSSASLRDNVVLASLRDLLAVLVIRQLHTAVRAATVPVHCISAYAHRASGLKCHSDGGTLS
jgi:hypothetical protein